MSTDEKAAEKTPEKADAKTPEETAKKPAEAETPPSSDPAQASKNSPDPAELGSHDSEHTDFSELETLADEAQKTPKIKELLNAQDIPSRFMTFLSLIFGFLAITSFVILVTVYVKGRKKHHSAPIEMAEPEAPVITESMGQFKVFLKRKANEGPMRELTVDIVVECLTQEACDALKTRLAEARDQVVPLLSTLNQEEWMRIESKVVLRRRIVEQLNSMKFPGKITKANFVDMMIETAE